MARNIRQSIGTTFSARDLKEGPLVLTIKDVYEDEYDGQTKNVVTFEEGKKKLVLNVTNTNILCDLFGDEDVDWFGKSIKLFASKTKYRGKMVDCIAVGLPED